MQMATCSKSLCLAPHPVPLEHVHASRMAGRALKLISTLAPVGSTAQPSPRPQDVVLVESLLQSKLLQVLTSTVQKLMPKHTAGIKGACGCCRPDADAWSRPVPSRRPQQPRVSVGQAVSTLLHRHLDLLVRANAWLESVAAAAPAPAPLNGSSSGSCSGSSRHHQQPVRFVKHQISKAIDTLFVPPPEYPQSNQPHSSHRCRL